MYFFYARAHALSPYGGIVNGDFAWAPLWGFTRAFVFRSVEERGGERRIRRVLYGDGVG